LKKENSFYEYNDLINLEDNDIIYIATTNNNHSFYSRNIAKNKKNILVEKLALLNSLDFKNDIETASDNSIFFLEVLSILIIHKHDFGYN
jgi:predicted dehydrogenase